MTESEHDPNSTDYHVRIRSVMKVYPCFINTVLLDMQTTGWCSSYMVNSMQPTMCVQINRKGS